MRRYLDLPYGLRPAELPRLELDRKRSGRILKAGVADKGLERLSTGTGQVDRKRARSRPEPMRLQQGQQAPHVIEVQMGDDDGVQVIRPRAKSAQGPGGRLATIDEQLRASEAVEKGRVPPVRGEETVPHAEAHDRRWGGLHRCGTRRRCGALAVSTHVGREGFRCTSRWGSRRSWG
jgi:hypothetical protein